MENKNIPKLFCRLPLIDWAKLIAVWMMISGYLYARGLLSAGMIGLFLLAFYPPGLAQHWKTFKRNRFAWLCLVFFFTYAVGGLWSADKENWLAILRVKLPFLAMPFAMLALPLNKALAQRILFSGILLIMLSGMLYSLYYVLQDPSAFLRGLHFKGPVTGDYIRHTVGLSLTANLGVYLLMHKRQLGLHAIEIVLSYVFLVAVFLYIHLQAAKSGVLTLYVLTAVFAISYIFRKSNYKQLLFSLVAGLVLVLVATQTVPPIQYQIQKVQGEIRMFKDKDTGRYQESSTIVPRLISYNVAVQLIRQHPFAGVGTGDMHNAVEQEYNRNYSFLIMRLIPHNQYLCTAVMIGLPLTLVLLLLVISPLTISRDIYTLANLLVLFVSTLVEAMLEVQFGVFIYLLFTLIWMAVFKKSDPIKMEPKT